MERQSKDAKHTPVQAQAPNGVRSGNLFVLVATALLLATMLMLQFSGLGILMITPTGVTILQVPVIIATLALGLPSGLFMGLSFGLLSMYMAYTTPALLNVPFMNPLVAVLPRLLIPLITYLFARLLRFDRMKPVWWKSICLGAVGSLTNTIFVLSSMALLYADITMQSLGVSKNALTGAVIAYGAASGLPEAAVSAVLCAAILAVMPVVLRSTRKKR